MPATAQAPAAKRAKKKSKAEAAPSAGEQDEQLHIGQRAMAMLENAPINVIFADLDCVIRYINPASVKQLRAIEHLLPIPADEILGQSIDTFHKKPETQRRLLADPSNLPHRTNIKLGDETLDLLVSAIYDDSGDYVGAMVTWNVITERLILEEKNLDYTNQINAISAAQAVIEFELDGTILTANENFLGATGYSLDEIRGKHHRIFCDPEEAAGPEYAEFWAKLNRGEADAGEYRRFGKGNAEIWIQARYSPLADQDGKLYKVVKYASDITEQVQMRREADERKVREQKEAEELKEKVDSLLSVVNAAADGDLTQEITVEGDDAIGQVGSGLKQLFNSLRESIAKMADTAVTLAGAAEELTAASEQMGTNAESTSEMAANSSRVSKEVDSNVQTVTTSVQEMNTTIQEIASNAHSAAQVAGEAVTAAEQTNTTISKLGESSTEIGKVIKVINSIAEQTNLLALNATIEAARAGEAGKGFAVVANEVKELAKATGRATEDIGQKIEAIQSDSRGAVDAIGQIAGVINQINEISTTIAGAVEEQTAMTREISRNVENAASGTGQITDHITSVETAAQETLGVVGNTKEAANDLARLGSQLQSLIGRFRI
ncbi:MAG: methyl-accepting chemotaxis protein [Planctomycetota bacterium]